MEQGQWSGSTWGVKMTGFDREIEGSVVKGFKRVGDNWSESKDRRGKIQ